MDDNLYDEFGNYIGPDIPDLDDSVEHEEEVEVEDRNDDDQPIIVIYNNKDKQ
jgi:U5 small nuclear ribonucleoprotein component